MRGVNIISDSSSAKNPTPSLRNPIHPRPLALPRSRSTLNAAGSFAHADSKLRRPLRRQQEASTSPRTPPGSFDAFDDAAFAARKLLARRQLLSRRQEASSLLCSGGNTVICTYSAAFQLNYSNRHSCLLFSSFFSSSHTSAYSSSSSCAKRTLSCHIQKAMMMFLIMFTMSAITLWLVSLWKIVATSSVEADPSTLFNLIKKGAGKERRKSNVLLVVAHPDDESMFFAPTLLHLTSNGHTIYILCISNGNAEGKGNIRKEELYQACATLKVPIQQIKIIDHLDLQDGFGKPWNHQLLAALVEEEIKKHCIDVLITFDNYGVSGHPNHRDVHSGIRKLLRENGEMNIEAWELISTNIFRKYIGPLDIWISLLSSSSVQRGRHICCLPNQHPLKCYQAMAEHYSQWVWFRKLFVLLSRYTYVNTLRKITC